MYDEDSECCFLLKWRARRVFSRVLRGRGWMHHFPPQKASAARRQISFRMHSPYAHWPTRIDSVNSARRSIASSMAVRGTAPCPPAAALLGIEGRVVLGLAASGFRQWPRGGAEESAWVSSPTM